MPLTDDLGDQVMAVVAAKSDPPVRWKRFRNGRFEAWLSRIAEDQPDLTTAENMANRTLFQLCSESLATVLDSSVSDAIQDMRSHEWLFDLLGTLHARRSTVVTFNQDTLLEFAIDDANLRVWNQERWRLDRPQPTIKWWDCLDCQPTFPPHRLTSPLPDASFRLLKLHGSTNWYWRAGDDSGATTSCWFLPGTVAPEQAVPDEASALRRELPGRVPLIVPPTAGKSTYYQTPMLSQLWQDARHALSRQPLHLSLLGYSIPPTDLVTSGMFRETLAEPTNPGSVSIDVVNPKPKPVKANLRLLGIKPSQVTTTESVESFVTSYLARAAAHVVSALRTVQRETDNCLVLTGTSVEHSRKVIRSGSVRNGVLELMIEDAKPPYTGPNIPANGQPSAIELVDLLGNLENESVSQLSVVTPTGESRPVVGATEYIRDTGAGSGRFQMLLTSRSVVAE